MPAERVAFVVIGENVHATRTYSRQGRHVGVVDGVEHLLFRDVHGAERRCPIAAPVATSTEFARNRVKHVRNGLLLGLGGDGLLPPGKAGPVRAEAALAGRDYLVAAAVAQERAGAHYIDINIDEIDDDEGIRVLAMTWLVEVLAPAIVVPLALDSSCLAVLEAGIRAGRRSPSRMLLNSASAERPGVLDLAARYGVPVVLSAAGVGSVPATATDRVDRADAILRAALERGIPEADCHVDLLVMPVGVDAAAGIGYLDAVRWFRRRYGWRVRVTGGLSNVSYGLPNRRLLNDVFVALAIDAGVDSGILDPVVLSVARSRLLDRETTAFRLAAAVLEGTDPFALAYLAAYRAGRLVQA